VRKLILVAAVLAAAVFGVAVTLTARPDLFRLASGPSQCHLAGAVSKAVAPFAEGTMVGFSPAEPRDVSGLPFSGTDTLSEFRGRTVLLNLWATWCAPCRIEMPHFAALHEAMSGADFTVIATSVDNRDENRPENFLAETNALALDYHREPTLTLFNSLRAADLAIGMPTTLLIAPDGCVAGVLHGAADWSGEQAKALIRSAVTAAKS